MKVRTLVLCGDCWHLAETVRRGLSPLGNAGFDFEYLADGAKCPAEMLDGFSLVVLAKANMVSPSDQRAWLKADSQMMFHDFLRRGNGLVVVHAGTSRYDDLPAMRSVIGGAFRHHPPPCRVAFEPKTGHLLAEGVAPFAADDEHYFVELDDAPADVFLHSRSEHGVQPAGWTRMEGGGRVCVLTPGHDLEVWLHPEFQKLLLNALRWAAKLNPVPVRVQTSR